jgi:hypothetical protein
MKKLILLGVALTALAGCDKLPFFKVSSPPRKAGLWEITIQSDRTPTPIVSQWCFDAASDKRTPVLPKGPRRAGACQKFAVAKSGDTYTVDSVCSVGAGGGPTLTSHAVISGDFTTKYTINSTIDVANSTDPTRNGEHKSTLTAVYKGADCGSDLSPGQVRTPTGDVVDMAQLRGGGMGMGGGHRGQGGGGNAAPSNSAAPATNGQ